MGSLIVGRDIIEIFDVVLILVILLFFCLLFVVLLMSGRDEDVCDCILCLVSWFVFCIGVVLVGCKMNFDGVWKF